MLAMCYNMPLLAPFVKLPAMCILLYCGGPTIVTPTCNSRHRRTTSIMLPEMAGSLHEFLSFIDTYSARRTSVIRIDNLISTKLFSTVSQAILSTHRSKKLTVLQNAARSGRQDPPCHYHRRRAGWTDQFDLAVATRHREHSVRTPPLNINPSQGSWHQPEND